jgi:hypothetical protein
MSFMYKSMSLNATQNLFAIPSAPGWPSAKFLPFPRLLRASKPYQRAPVFQKHKSRKTFAFAK